ncbi:MAG: hypothetical protein ACRDTJ_32315, partial [Pseudonocardiaceae bacterium]
MVEHGFDRPSRREAAGLLDGAGADPRAAGVGSVRLPASTVEPVRGLNSGVLVVTLNDHYLDRSHPAPRHRQHGIIGQRDRSNLPVRVPGQQLHPRLRRSSWDGP